MSVLLNVIDGAFMCPLKLGFDVNRMINVAEESKHSVNSQKIFFFNNIFGPFCLYLIVTVTDTFRKQSKRGGWH